MVEEGALEQWYYGNRVIPALCEIDGPNNPQKSKTLNCGPNTYGINSIQKSIMF